MAFDGVYSVYTYTSTNKGGLGLPVDKIGIAMFCGNLAFILTVPTVLPVLIDRCGLVNSQQGLILLWPLVGLSLPLCNWIAKEAHSFMWPFIALQQLAKAVGGFVWVYVKFRYDPGLMSRSPVQVEPHDDDGLV